MSDLLIQGFTSFVYALEDFVNIKYLPALLANISSSLVIYIGLSILVIVLTLSIWPNPVDSAPKVSQPSGFDISPDDDIRFESSVTNEEINEAVRKNTPGAYIPLSGNASEEQIEQFLKGAGDENGHDAGTLAARVKKARQAAIRKKIESEMTEDEKLNEQDVQRQQLEKIFSLLNKHESNVGKMSEEDLQKQLKMYK